VGGSASTSCELEDRERGKTRSDCYVRSYLSSNLDVLPIYIDGLAIRLRGGAKSVTVQIPVGVHELGFRNEKDSCILEVEPNGVYKVEVMPNADSPWGNRRLEAVN
jgi:hypothetical protein